MIPAGEVIRRAVAPPMQRGPASILANGANNQRDATGGYGSYTLNPDPQVLSQYVESNPNVISARLAQQYQGGQSSDALRQYLQQQLINYGGTDIAKQLGLAVDPVTAKLAAANTHSILAQMNLAAGQSRDDMLAHLAATGQIHSGQLGFDINNFNNDQSQQQYQAGQTLLGNLSQANNQNLSTQAKLASGIQSAVVRAGGQVYAHPNSFPLPGPQRVTVGAAPNPAVKLKPMVAPKPIVRAAPSAAPAFGAAGGAQ